MKKRALITLAALSLALTACVAADTKPLVQKPQHFTFKKTLTAELDYLLFLPKGYSATSGKRWPLMLFLHGAGERGNDVAKVTVHGPPKIVERDPNFPFILVSPQCPEGQTWNREVLLGLLDKIESSYAVDTNRVYLTGLSMGGYGTWDLGLSNPERFAAIVPICGGGQPLTVMLAGRTKADALKTLGVWAFHGAKDPVVPLEESQRMVGALERAGVKDVRLTVYPDAQHDSWTETYNNPKLYDWLLEHQRK